MPSFIDVGPAVSEPWGFENVDGRTDGRTDIRLVLQVISRHMTKTEIALQLKR